MYIIIPIKNAIDFLPFHRRLVYWVVVQCYPWWRLPLNIVRVLQRTRQNSRVVVNGGGRNLFDQTHDVIIPFKVLVSLIMESTSLDPSSPNHLGSFHYAITRKRSTLSLSAGTLVQVHQSLRIKGVSFRPSTATNRRRQNRGVNLRLPAPMVPRLRAIVGLCHGAQVCPAARCDMHAFTCSWCMWCRRSVHILHTFF